MNHLVLVVLLTLSISALCSFLEATLYSTRLGVLEAARAGGRRRLADRFLQMKRDISSPTSGILILNTLANTGGATLAGMYAAQALGHASVLYVSLGLTAGILFLSEILPKTIGATRWRTAWWTAVWPLILIQKTLYPAIWATRKFSDLFMGGKSVPPVTEEEIQASIRLGARAGELTVEEQRLLNAVFHFDELLCRQVMVPRGEVVFLDASWDLPRWIEVAHRTKHTRYPICKGTLDDAIGLIHIKDLVGVAPDREIDLARLIRPLRHIPETMQLNQLLREMQRTRQHMALVINEYGTTVGIITLEIVLEQIVGAVQDEFDAEKPVIQPEGKGRFIVRGVTPIAHLNHELNLRLRAGRVATLSGLLVSRAGRLLEVGDRIPLRGATAEVLEVESGRAVRVRLILEGD